jgi:ATP-dependent phosphofructokinase / diphosphate-dependent phosphofructokinase
MRVGVLTGGGDCPGLNAVMRGVVRKAENTYGDEIIGFRDGWKGVINNETVELSIASMRGTLTRGGTVLGTSRVHPWMQEDGVEKIAATVADQNLDAMIVIGGEGTLSCARRLHDEGVINVIGIPKTIDNDISATDMTFGFMTAVEVAADAVDRLHSTAESHDRVMVLEVMGRHVGHIAMWAGLAGGATVTLVPEEPFDIAEVAESIKRRHEKGRFASIVVVAEGALPKPGTLDVVEPEVDIYGHQRLGGIGATVAAEIEKLTGFETRVTVLGYVQRGGTPSAFDRVLCTWYGVAAIDAVHQGDFGRMVSFQNAGMTTVSLDDAVGGLKTIDPQLWDVAKTFFG